MKNSAAIGFHTRINLNCEWHLVPGLSRTVAVRKVTKEDSHFQTCEDCGKESHLVVVELSRFTPKGRRNAYPLVWGWCGVCDIGRGLE